jgi:short-subunit dehydrogenase
MKVQNVLIVGATSAIASACARRWAVPGASFFLVGRSEDKLNQVGADLSARGAGVHSSVLDLNQWERHAAMLDDCFATLGQVDIALIAHGTLPDQAACERDAPRAAAEFNTNALSVITFLTELAPRMQAQKSGCIAVITSVAGDRGRASNYLYGAAKGAVSIFCSGLRVRMARVGVQVLTIKPGFVDTPITQGLNLPGLLLATPDAVAQDIQAAIEQRRSTLYTPWFWRYVMLAVTHLPEALFKRLSL